MRQLQNDKSNRIAEWARILGVIALLAAMGVLAGRASSEEVAQADEEGAATRAVPQQERAKQTGKPSQPGKEAQSGKQGQADQRLPTFPQKFNVQGPEPEFFAFAVTQPGPVVVNVQAQGAPLVVTLQSPGGQPIAQQGAGNVRLDYNVKPQDVQRNLFWNVQIRLAQPRAPQQGGRAAGTVNVQHPPVDQAAVRQAMNAQAQQKQQAPQGQQQSDPQAEAQLNQAFQQRKAQFEQTQQQRRAALFSRIQPQVVQLRNRAGKGQKVKSRGVEGAEETEVAGETYVYGQSVATRGTPTLQRPMRPGQENERPIGFPQKFHVQGPESSSYGFGITQPGPIEVGVEAQGMPIELTLQRLGSAPITEQGQGQVRLTHEVTPEDVQQSALWVVRISLPEAVARSQGAEASGTINVQHPEADPAVIQAQSTALEARERANRERFATEAGAEAQAEFREFKARIEQQHLQRQAKDRAQIQPMLQQMRSQPVSMIRTRGVAPVIDRLSRSEGQPKDQVILYGSNFGTGGEVVFQLGQNVWGTAIIDGWSDTLIIANVPDASGLLPFDGYVVVSAQAQSNSLPFRFVPLPEVREIRSTRGDISIAQPGTVQSGTTGTSEVIYHDNTTFMTLGGSKGNDIFFPTSRLQNGWVVQEIKPRAAGCGTPFCTGVTVADSRVGTELAYFNVRWWYDALANLQYWFHMWVVGPRGVPDGILVSGPLQPVVPPGTPRPSPTPTEESPGTTAETTIVQLDPRLDKAQRTPTEQSNPSYQPPASQQPSGQPTEPDPTIVQLEPGPGKARPDKSAGTPSYEPPASQSPELVLTVVPVILNPVLLGSGSGTSTPPADSGSGGSQQQGNQNPAITSLSVGQGQPGDPVMITGNNFGTGTGEIHFVIGSGPGKDLKAPDGAIWSDNQIFTSVPIVDGVMAFNGQLYVKRASDQKMSNLVAFRFDPILEIREIRATMDRVLRNPVWQQAWAPQEIHHGRSPANYLFGDKDNDEFLLNARLKNGWITADAQVTCISNQSTNCDGGAYLWEIKQGTDWPYLNVRWWLNPDPPFGFSRVKYNYAVRIVGPKGLGDGVVVP